MTETIAVVQMASGPNLDANLLEAERLLQQAAAAGAALVVLPENFALLGMRDADLLEHREEPGAGRVQQFVAEQCRRHRLWIVAGTIPLQCEDPKRLASSCMLFDDAGAMRARYDKIHLFDVTLVASGESYNESATMRPGSEVVVAQTPFGMLGLAVCYDLRFPELFRAMLDQGVETVALPAAFTAVTGKAHWATLLRARAIENLIFLAASAQGGYHLNGRETWGHSAILDPWGQLLGEQDHGAGVVVAALDREKQAEIRRSFPSIDNRRLVCRMKS